MRTNHSIISIYNFMLDEIEGKNVTYSLLYEYENGFKYTFCKILTKEKWVVPCWLENLCLRSHEQWHCSLRYIKQVTVLWCSHCNIVPWSFFSIKHFWSLNGSSIGINIEKSVLFRIVVDVIPGRKKMKVSLVRNGK